MVSASENNYLSEFVDKMVKAGVPPIAIKSFSHYYQQILLGDKGLLPEKEILPVDPSSIKKFDQLTDYRSSGQNALPKAVKIILNGGLGTSMGLLGPKSTLRVKNNLSFLDILLRQAEMANVKLVLMNSFSTHETSVKVLNELNPPNPPLLFCQHMFPKVLRKNLAPAQSPENPDLEWNPPGHGDIFIAMYTSGILNQLLDNGIRYALITNTDNLGATLDESLLGFFADKNLPFMMEVAVRSPADKKGGHLAYSKAGHFVLREIAQCPENELSKFQDIQLHCFFNTNNIWLNLEALQEKIQDLGFLPLPLILNPKTLDPREENSPPVFQIETAMGSAISMFPEAIPVKVPSERFHPVKKCDDLLAIRSDCYYLDNEYKLQINPARSYERIKIELDPAYYTKIDQLNKRFPYGAPSLVHCRSLCIRGNVCFEKGVVLKGDVLIENCGTSQAVVNQGSVIEGNFIFE